MHEYGTSEADLAQLAVLMRRHAVHASRRAVPRTDQRRRRAGVEADRAPAQAARLLSGLRRRRRLRREPRAAERFPRAHHRHRPGAHPPARQRRTEPHAVRRRRRRAQAAMEAARIGIADVEYAAIYDSFTITLTILLEEIGLAPRGGAGGWRARRPFLARRRAAAQHARRPAVLRPLRRRRRHGASGRDAPADDRSRRDRAGARRRDSRCCTATAACCRRMSACFWSGCDERQTRGLDQRRGSDRLSALRRLRRAAVFPPCLLRGLRSVELPTSGPAARGRFMPPRSSAAAATSETGRACPTTSCWSMPPKVFA